MISASSWIVRGIATRHTVAYDGCPCSANSESGSQTGFFTGLQSLSPLLCYPLILMVASILRYTW